MFVSIKKDRWFRAVFRGLIDDYKEDKEMNIDDIILLLKKIEDIEEFTVKLNLESCGAGSIVYLESLENIFTFDNIDELYKELVCYFQCDTEGVKSRLERFITRLKRGS